MKKAALLFAVILSSIIVNAQITLENTYPTGGLAIGNLYPIKLSTSGYKYQFVDKVNSEIILYNLNHSIFKNIFVPAQTASVWDVHHVSETLFDTDGSTIEYLIQGKGSELYVKIYDELGNTLLSIDSAQLGGIDFFYGYKPIFNTDSGTKMIVSGNTWAQVYSLPGTLQAYSTTTDNYNLNNLNKTSLSYPYPNPSNNFTKIDYKLPEGINQGEIVLYNIQGKEIKRYKVDKTFDHLRISAYELPAGNYYFNLRTSRGISEGKKMIVIK